MKFRGILALALGLGVLLLARPALAYEYPVPIYVSNEDDILELYFAQDITEEEQNQLLKLLQEPIELNSATREDIYNLPGITWSMADAIIARRKTTPFRRLNDVKRVPGVSADIIMQIKSFVDIVPPKAPKAAKGKKPKKGKAPKKSFEVFEGIRGTVNYTVMDEVKPGDVDGPEMSLRLQAKDRAGNAANLTLPAPIPPGSFGGPGVIAVDAKIGVLSTSPFLSQTPPGPIYRVPLRTIDIVFTTPVTGVSLAGIKLYFQDRSVSLTGATITGSGATYRLTLPRSATSLNGSYRLRIGGVQSGISADSGDGGTVPMMPVNLYWQKAK
jgi:hypothetical protein